MTAPNEFTKQKALGLPTFQDEAAMVDEKYGTASGHEHQDPWQVRLLKFLNSSSVTHFLIGLLMLDVTILFIELGMDAFFPSCHTITRDAISCCPLSSDASALAASHGDDHAGVTTHSTESDHHFLMRLLSSSEHGVCESGVDSDYPAGCDDHKYPGVHITHTVLFSFTVAILCIFEVELFTMMYLIGLKAFMSNLFYMLDLFVVSVSLALELTFKFLHNDIASELIGILIFFRLWRFVRIGHGFFASSHELAEEKMEEVEEYVEELEKMVKDLGGKLPEHSPIHHKGHEDDHHDKPMNSVKEVEA